MKDQFKKLITLKDDPVIGFFDEIRELNDLLTKVVSAIESSKTTEVSILNQEQPDFSSVEEGLGKVVEAIGGIKFPEQKETKIDLSGVERLLNKISEKKDKEVDVSELKNISRILGDVLFAAQSISSKEEKEVDISPLTAILKLINENIVAIEFPDFDYERLERAIKGIDINISAGGGSTAKVEAQQIDGTQKTKIVDTSGDVWELESNGAMPVNIQDQHTPIVEFYFRQLLNTITLASNVTIDTYTCTLTAGHNVVVGNTLVFKEGTSFFQADVLTVVTNTITIDRPFDFAFTTAASGERTSKNLAVNGSVTPVTFYISPAGLTNVEVDITKLHFHIEDATAMTSATFGGMTALAKGIVLRVKNGITKVLFNAKTNGDFYHHADSVSFDDRAAASSVYSVTAIKRFAGQENSGVVIRLASTTSDQLQVIVQDDLTGLLEFHVVAQGHVVTN